MAIAHILLDENSGYVVETPVLVPLKWRYKVSSTVLLKNGEYVVSNNPNVTTPGTSVSYDPAEPNWNSGGVAAISRTVCKWQNGSGYFFRRSYAAIYRPFASWTYVHVSASLAITITDKAPEVDFEDCMATVRATYDPRFYAIGAIRFCDSGGDNCVNPTQEGYIDLDTLNNFFRNTDHTGEEVTADIWNFLLETTSSEETRPYGPGGIDIPFNYTDEFTIDGVTDDEDGQNFNQTCQDLATNSCASNGRNIPMYMKVWVKLIVAGSGAYPGEATVNDEDEQDDPEEWAPLGGGSTSGSTGKGSEDEGMNTIYSTYGNSQLPFDSVYLTGANYNSFVSAGGGVVAESGFFPISDTLYIDKIRLDVEGSTMTVVEVVDYDATPSLALSEKIYGYIFNEYNQSKPIFAGYVISRRRRLNSNTKEIVYECRDLSYFFDQLYSPSHYIYRPPSAGGSGTIKTYDRVLKEILNVAGVPNALIDIPTYTAPPTSWVYQDLRSVLEWVVKFFGKYVYYIDRYGRLNVRATDSLSNVKSYTIGDKSGEIAVEGFEPVADFSRSRSRVVLTGDYQIIEREATANYKLGGQLHPEDNDNQTGIFWFTETIEGKTYKFYYFMLKPGQTLNDKLLSDPSKSAEITLLKQANSATNPNSSSIDDPKELSIRVFKTDPGDSDIYVEDPILNYKNYQLIRARYATRSDSPIQVYKDTGRSGGTEVVRRPEFKKVSGPQGNIDDTPLMKQYIAKIMDFYKPVYGGQLTLDGLDTEVYLLAKVSIDGTDLSSTETDNLICYAIEYDCANKRTTIDLSNKVYGGLPFFDIIRERTSEHNEILAKMGLVEESELYQRR